jgi:hypothetical protein
LREDAKVEDISCQILNLSNVLKIENEAERFGGDEQNSG